MRSWGGGVRGGGGVRRGEEEQRSSEVRVRGSEEEMRRKMKRVEKQTPDRPRWSGLGLPRVEIQSCKET